MPYKGVRAWIREYGFPLLVLADLVGSAYLATTTSLPTAVPDYALQAGSVYRLEVGSACFVVIYLAAMALFLAIDGWGFTELGPKGLRATEVMRASDEQGATLSEQMMLIRNMEKDLEDAKAALNRSATRLNEQEQRVRRLEDK